MRFVEVVLSGSFFLQCTKIQMDFRQEICDTIASYVDSRDLTSLRFVSKTWKSAAALQAFVSNVKSTFERNNSELMRFVIEFPRLHTLMPIGRQITATGLANACASLNRLHTVDLRACPQVTAVFLGLLRDFLNIRWGFTLLVMISCKHQRR